MSFRILISEDEPAIREAFKEFIQTEYPDSIVDCCEDGLEAFSFAHNFQYDLIITDYKIPRLNGIEFLKGIREMESKNKTTKVIFCSGYVPEFEKQITNLEDILILSKPVDSKSLIRNVKLSLYQSRAS